MGKRSRRKGKAGEREAAAFLRGLFPSHAEGIRRGWQSRQGDDEADVEGVPHDLWVEVKSGKAPPFLPALAQAEDAMTDKHHALVLVRKDGGANTPPTRLALMRWATLDHLLTAERAAGFPGDLRAAVSAVLEEHRTKSTDELLDDLVSLLQLRA